MEEKKEANNNNEEVESQLITIQKYISLLILEFKEHIQKYNLMFQDISHNTNVHFDKFEEIINDYIEEIKQKAYEANMLLYKYGIAPFTWGNASACDREARVFAIKPSGVPYESLSPEDMVIVDFDGSKVEGALSPSSDTPTHAVLYRAFPEIGGVVHTHSVNAVAFAQAGAEIPAFGTTHADFCYGAVPCTRELTKAEVETEYEKNTGLVIAEYFRNTNTDENAVPAVLVKSHGPFCWGKDAKTAAYNAAVLEIVAEMALKTARVGGEAAPIPQHLLDKHYLRKHGKNAYYGQVKKD